MVNPGKAAIIYHAGSGRGRSTAILTPLREQLVASGWQVEREEQTRYEGHAREELAPALAGEVDLIVVIGGDGMLREVSEGLGKASSQTPVGLVPTGNANVVAREMGIPLEPMGAINLLSNGTVRRLDTGMVRTRPGGDRQFSQGSLGHHFFLAMVEVGFGARIVHFTHRLRNSLLRPVYRMWGAPVYFTAALGAAAFPGEVPFTIETDRDQSPRKATGAIVTNTRCYATGWSLAPDARMDDGWLDLVCRSRKGPATALRSYAAAARSVPQPKGVSWHKRGRRFVFWAEKPMTVQVDGDPIPPTDWLEVRVTPGGIGLVSP